MWLGFGSSILGETITCLRWIMVKSKNDSMILLEPDSNWRFSLKIYRVLEPINGTEIYGNENILC